VLSVTSSGIAALLLPLGKTAHSMFKIPMDANEKSSCSIPKKSKLSHLIREASLLTWDEAPITHRYTLEAFEHSLCNICNRNLAFDGKMIIFGGDFRHLLLVVTKGSREDVVPSSISRASCWCYCNV